MNPKTKAIRKKVEDPFEKARRRLTPAESREKTKDWPIMQKGFKPKDAFQELAYTHFRK